MVTTFIDLNEKLKLLVEIRFQLRNAILLNLKKQLLSNFRLRLPTYVDLRNLKLMLFDRNLITYFNVFAIAFAYLTTYLLYNHDKLSQLA